MIFEQHYLECLSQASYFIGDQATGRAVVVDPRRDITPYVETAEANQMTIELVIETHFHADFLSGHLEMQAATGASIAYGSAAETEFESRKLNDGEEIVLGSVMLQIRHTPGHTPESISVVVYERHDDPAPYAVLTGDTMFVGDVGRPDLLSSKGVTSEELASSLYDSLHNKLLTLPDVTRVYPAHGAGSSCGKNLSSETWSTIGEQRSKNYALAPMCKEEFVAVVTDGQTAPPAYFSYDAVRNRESRDIFEESAPEALSLARAVELRDAGAVVLDTRDPNDFASGYLRGSVNIGLAGRYAEYAGGVFSPDASIVLVCDEGTELEAKTRLARIGYDNVVGALEQPLVAFAENPDEVSRGKRIGVDTLREVIEGVVNLQLVDVRQPGETEGGTIEGAIVIPLTQLNDQLETLDPDRPTVVYCAGGFRSSIAASRMIGAGVEDVADLLGGYGAWSAAVGEAS